ncbi:MAG: SDR family oxidoreductase, partial [Thermoanaerobaculia bacterium]
MTATRIAVIGATGMLGRPVVRKLVETGWDVAALTRSPEKAEALEGVRVVRADLFDPASLRVALRDREALYLNLSIAPGERPDGPHAETDGLRNAIAAARECGVRRIGIISS